MKILFVASEKQQMPGIIIALARMGHEVEMYETPMEKIENHEEEEDAIDRYLHKMKPDFVLSNVFTREVARASNRLEIKYAVWCMDSPSFPAYVPEAEYDNCYLFYFDYRECEQKRRQGQRRAYHMPLAADIVQNEKLRITDEEIRRYACDMSFVGGMYTNNMYDRAVEAFSPQVRNAVSDIIEQGAFLWDGQDRLQVSEELLMAVRRDCPSVFNHPSVMSDEFFFKTCYVARKMTNVERVLMMDLLAKQFDIHLYTWDREKVPEGVRRFPDVSAADGALKVYYSSKINLNITLRSILSGIPARVFDVMSMGGFMLSNWQEEIPELFVEDKEIVTYRTPEELVDKADHYLKHEDQRKQIAANGYLKVKEHFTWEKQLEKIIDVLYPKH